MMTFYLIIVIALFVLAISDLIVGVSNDAVNFLNSAVGSRVAGFKQILIVAGIGIIFGCTFSSGMMEVARKGIFHPEYFYFSEIILLFLAVMVTDVILLDTFNTFGLPTSTTVSIVFELLGAAVALSLIKIMNEPNALSLGEYINSDKALAIISGILLSVIVAFTVGLLVQYLTRLLFSFDYKKENKFKASLWGGLSISAITYFILVKGAKGASFMTPEIKEMISNQAVMIIAVSFVVWTILIHILQLFAKLDVFKMIVLVGTFALAMAFAGNDLVNFIGVPLASYNSYELFKASGMAADAYSMEGLAGKVPTPTLFLLVAGIIMTVTLWMSKKARNVIKTSLDLGRQDEGDEGFSSTFISRGMVRNITKFAGVVWEATPRRWQSGLLSRFDETPFKNYQKQLGDDAPAFDMIRAAVTLVVSSILIAIGTALKLPLSTTYVTFMVFMGTSLADGAWGRESAVYRVTGVLSVIGGWFFTAFSAFTVSFIFAMIFYYGGPIAVCLVLLLSAYLIYHSHTHGSKEDDAIEFEREVDEGAISKETAIHLIVDHLSLVFAKTDVILGKSIEGLKNENLKTLASSYRDSKSLMEQISKLHRKANRALDKIEDDELEAGHLYILVIEYVKDLVRHVYNISKETMSHVDNSHKGMLPVQIEELEGLKNELADYNESALEVFRSLSRPLADKQINRIGSFIKEIRQARKKQIKRIKHHEIGTRNSQLYLFIVGEIRNVLLFSHRLVNVCNDLVINEDES